MRNIAISILSLFAVIPAFAVGSLPVVNVSSAAVSARAEFGEPILMIDKKTKTTQIEDVVFEPVVVKTKTVQIEKEEFQTDDLLIPKKPRGDLWAKSSEDVDFLLPEESLDPIQITSNRTVNNRPKYNPEVVSAQINKMVEAKQEKEISEQKFAQNREVNDRVRFESVPVVRTATDLNKQIVEKRKESEVKINRMVVEDVEKPMPVKTYKPIFNNPTDEFVKMSPTELKKAFKRTYMSENKHLSAYKVDDKFDVISDAVSNEEGFTASTDLSESDAGVRPLEIKITFLGDDSSLSRDNYNLLSEYATIVAKNPKRAIQIFMPQSVTHTSDSRKMAAKRLAIIEQVLEDTGVSEQKIMPSLSRRDDDSFVLRVISSDVYESLTKQKKDIFGDSVDSKTYKSMAW